MAKIIAQRGTPLSVFKIEKGVSLMPKDPVSRKYPFTQMEVGDSFFIENPAIDDIGRIRSSACIYGKRTNKKFSIRKDGQKSGSYRCWRLL